jgi:hypothetical protein
VTASDRLKCCFSLFELGEQHALDPGMAVPDLRVDREGCGLKDASLDEGVASGCLDDEGALRVRHAAVLQRVIVDALEDMIGLLALSPSSVRSAAELRERAKLLLAAMPRVEGDRVPAGYVGRLTRPIGEISR